MTDYTIEHIGANEYAFTAIGAPERSTGWQDCYCVDMSTGDVEFYDAEENLRCAVSPIRDLEVAIRHFEDTLADEREDDYEPSNSIGLEDF